MCPNWMATHIVLPSTATHGIRTCLYLYIELMATTRRRFKRHKQGHVIAVTRSTSASMPLSFVHTDTYTQRRVP